MKTSKFRTRWVVVTVAIALVGGGYPLVKYYLGLRADIRAAEQTSETATRLCEEVRLTRILILAQENHCAAPARSLDELLSDHLVAINSQLGSADPQIRGMVERCSRFVDHWRSQTMPDTAGLPAGHSELELAAQRALAPSLASASPAR
jgi:hypothetical protein